LFSEPAYDITLANSSASEYHPITSLQDAAATVEFFIQGNDSQWIDLTETKLYLKVKTLASDYKTLAGTNLVAPVNHFLR